MYNDLFSIGSVTVHTYGVMIAAGILLALFSGMYRAKRYGLEKGRVVDIVLLVVITGFLGAKLLYVLVEFPTFLKDPLSVLGSGGFVLYGGIIIGVIATIIFCHFKKLSFKSYFDLLMPSVVMAQGLGRIGCFFAGCCYGAETHSCIGVTFPAGSIAPAGVSLIPTQLISAAGDFVIALILIMYAKNRAKYKGNTGAMYLLLYGVGRFAIEFLRSDPRGAVGILSTSQFISIFFIIAAIVLFVINKKKGTPADKFIGNAAVGDGGTAEPTRGTPIKANKPANRMWTAPVPGKKPYGFGKKK